ncbi:MAG: hypothetical protein AAGJ34_02630 [Pseudomonadota bacterium]
MEHDALYQSALLRLRDDIKHFQVEILEDEWNHFARQVSFLNVRAGLQIQNQARISDIWVFLVSGIAASEQTWRDGTTTITRFFTPGDICANFTSVWRQEIAADDLIALTDVSGLAFPDQVFRPEYLSGGSFGTYLRLKMITTHLLDKELLCAKTSKRIEMRYQFLEEYQKDVIDAVMQKDIARFLGVTPQGLSRFLKHKNECL